MGQKPIEGSNPSLSATRPINSRRFRSLGCDSDEAGITPVRAARRARRAAPSNPSLSAIRHVNSRPVSTTQSWQPRSGDSEPEIWKRGFNKIAEGDFGDDARVARRARPEGPFQSSLSARWPAKSRCSLSLTRDSGKAPNCAFASVIGREHWRNECGGDRSLDTFNVCAVLFWEVGGPKLHKEFLRGQA